MDRHEMLERLTYARINCRLLQDRLDKLAITVHVAVVQIGEIEDSLRQFGEAIGPPAIVGVEVSP